MSRVDVLAVSGTRADWGLLAPVLALLRDDAALHLRLAVTGQHLMAGATSLKAIADDGFRVDHSVEMGLDGEDTCHATTRAMARAVAGFGDLLAERRPDLMLVLGDRYEIYAAVSAALMANVPVAHLCGGDLTEGAIDDAFRHCITKMAHLHFVSNADAARRVGQLGEDPTRIHTVGSPGLDRIRQMSILDRSSFFRCVGLEPRRRNLLVAFHPVTLANDSARQLQAMLDSLGEFRDGGLILTGSNADPEGPTISAALKAFAGGKENAVFHASLGSQLFFSALAHVDAIVGNSSSGLYEAPSFKTATVNIGDRQRGRLRAASVIDCEPKSGAIGDAIARAFELDCDGVENPYGDGHAAERIVGILKSLEDPADLLRKRFYDLQ